MIQVTNVQSTKTKQKSTDKWYTNNTYKISSLTNFIMFKVLRGRPKMSTFSQVYKPYTRAEGVTPDVRL